MLRPTLLMLAALATPFAFASQTHLSTPSTWTLNLHESNFGGGPTMKSDVFVMLTDTARWAKYTDATDYGDGKILKTSWSGPADGTTHNIVGMDGATFADNAATDTTVEVLPGGTTFKCNFSVTPDKKKFKQNCIVKTETGKEFHQALVYDRTK
jgi:hypothetical protein